MRGAELAKTERVFEIRDITNGEKLGTITVEKNGPRLRATKSTKSFRVVDVFDGDSRLSCSLQDNGGATFRDAAGTVQFALEDYELRDEKGRARLVVEDVHPGREHEQDEVEEIIIRLESLP
jgi:hypothetical protein